MAEQEEGSLGICKAIVMTVSFYPTDLEALNEIYLIHNIVYMYETVSGDLYLESQHLGGKGRNLEFKVILNCTASSRPALAT